MADGNTISVELISRPTVSVEGGTTVEISVYPLRSGAGDVLGPGASTDNAIARWNGTGGNVLQNSGITIADGASGTLSGTNSGDVTLAGESYLSLAGQQITAAQINLASQVTGDLPYANLTPALAGSLLLGRGDSGAGDWQPITLGASFSMSGTTLDVAAGAGGITQLTGDVTAGPGTGSQAATLATVNSNVGAFGSASKTLQVTANGKGLITAIAQTDIQIAESQVTNLTTDLAGKQPLDATLTALAGLTITQGSLIYGTGADAFAVLAKDTNATRYLSNTGTSNNPAWAQVDLSNGVTGDLPFANFVQAGSAGFVGATGAGDYSHRTPTQVTAALDNFVGDSGAGGTKGLTPAPAAGDAAAGKFLKADGTWATPAGSGDVAASGTLTNNALIIGQGGTTVAATSTGAGILTFLGTPSSANLAAAVTGETGTGALVFGTNPTLDAPTINGSVATTGLTLPAHTSGALTMVGSIDLDGYDVVDVNVLLAGEDFGFMQTHTHVGDTWSLQAYDTNAASYSSFIVLTAGNPPTCVFTNVALGTPLSGTLSNCDAFTGDSGAGGTKGVVPAPAAGDAAAGKFLKADGTWATPAGSGDVVASGTLTSNAIIIGQGSTTVAATSTAAGILTFIGTPSSANLAAALTDETGTGLAVFNNSPTFVDDITIGGSGIATGIVKLAGTTSGIVSLSVADAAGTWTFKLPTSAGSSGQFLKTDGSGNASWDTPTGSGDVVASGTLTNNAIIIGQGTTTVAATSTAAGILTFIGTPSSANLAAALTDETGTGVAVFNNSPTFVDDITIGGSGVATGSILLKGTTSGTVTLKVADAAGTWTMTLPTTDGDSGQVLSTDGSGVCSWVAAGGVPTTITVANEATDTTCFPLFVTAATGDLGPKSNTGLTFDSSTRTLGLGVAAGATGKLNLLGTTSGVVTLSVADAAGTWTMKLPTDDGTSGQYLKTDGSGNCSWDTPSGGGTININQTLKTDTFSTSSVNTYVDVTGLSVSITPSTSSKKILIIVHISFDVSTGQAAFQVLRGSTPIGVGDSRGSRLQAGGGMYLYPNSYGQTTVAYSFLDSPATTSSTTYKVQVTGLSGGAMTTYINRSASDTDAAYQVTATSGITVMEVN